MKQYRITYNGKAYTMNAKDEASALSIFNHTLKDDKLSPKTYEQLKKLGLKPENWKGWTQEQANAYIRNHKEKSETRYEKPKENEVEAQKKVKSPEENASTEKETMQVINEYREKYAKMTPLEKLNELPDGVKEKVVDVLKNLSNNRPSYEEYKKALDKKIPPPLTDKERETLSNRARIKILTGKYTTEDFEKDPAYQKIRKDISMLGSYVIPEDEVERTVADKSKEYFDKVKSYNPKTKKFDGEVKCEKIVNICVGLPAAGKSSVLANPLSEKYGARIIDSDEVKKMLPGYNNGVGAGYVHEASKRVLEGEDGILQQAIERGENIVYPIVGGGDDSRSLQKKIKKFKDAGYTVHLCLNDVPNDVSQQRVMTRFGMDGRFFDMAIPRNYGDTPTKNFEDIITNHKELIDSYQRWDNSTKKKELISARIIKHPRSNKTKE